MAAQQMHADAGRDRLIAVDEAHLSRIQLLDRRRDIARLERLSQYVVAHAAAGAIRHLRFLEMEAGLRKTTDIAGVVVMHVRDDDVRHRRGIDVQLAQQGERRMQVGAATPRRHLRREARIDHDGPLCVAEHPDVEIEVHRCIVVRVLAQVVLAAAAAVVPRVAQRVNLVGLGSKIGAVRQFVVSRVSCRFRPSSRAMRTIDSCSRAPSAAFWKKN